MRAVPGPAGGGAGRRARGGECFVEARADEERARTQTPVCALTSRDRQSTAPRIGRGLTGDGG
ncbi:hypothetical protein D5H75_00200 [Bailinhaonella thermotolerans]|uniref:Uncharacterized protein n=1 Tax=Bailinhaonella thermotolerans TaxID=1070861 RepID=A0A3A4AXB5_9ACTN|nr:hypothetical protein D5H75_00200 [Bailinhaonella thermotolerans]